MGTREKEKGYELTGSWEDRRSKGSEVVNDESGEEGSARTREEGRLSLALVLVHIDHWFTEGCVSSALGLCIGFDLRLKIVVWRYC